MPLLLVLAIVAVGVALAMRSSRGGSERGGRFVATAAGVWAALIMVVLIVVTVATLIFGR
ncbi:MAG: hypothetical protein WCA57_03820 [Ilumatobacteraceae bacterium]